MYFKHEKSLWDNRNVQKQDQGNSFNSVKFQKIIQLYAHRANFVLCKSHLKPLPKQNEKGSMLMQ